MQDGCFENSHLNYSSPLGGCTLVFQSQVAPEVGRPVLAFTAEEYIGGGCGALVGGSGCGNKQRLAAAWARDALVAPALVPAPRWARQGLGAWLLCLQPSLTVPWPRKG